MSRIELIGGGSGGWRTAGASVVAALAVAASADSATTIAVAPVDGGSRVIAAAPPSGIGRIDEPGETDPIAAPEAGDDSDATAAAGASGGSETTASAADDHAAGGGGVLSWIVPAIGLVVLVWWVVRRSWRLRPAGEPPVDEHAPPTARWPIDPAMLAAAIAVLMLAPALGQSAAIALAAPESGTLAFTGTAMLGGALVECAVAAALLVLVLSLRARAAGTSIVAFVAPGIRPGLRVGVLAGLGGVPVVFAVGTVVTAAVRALGVGPPDDGPAHDTLAQLVEQDVTVWTVVIGILVTTAVPFTEEVLYRGLLPEVLRRVGLSVWPTILGSAAIFAVAHIGALDAASLATTLSMLFVLGVILGWAAERTRGLLAPMVIHALFNGANLLIASA